MGAGARWLAGDAPRPVHRGDARRRPLHRRRPALLDLAGRRAEHALARRRRAPPPSRPVRQGVPRSRCQDPVHQGGSTRPAGWSSADPSPARPRSAATWPVRWPSTSSPPHSSSRTPSPASSSAGTTRSWRRSIASRSEGDRRGGAPGGRGARRHVAGSVEDGRGVLSTAAATLTPPEVVSNAAVMMFGGIETSEGMTTSLFWHLLSDPDQLAAVRADRSLLPNAVEESLRLEPAAARVDRYATADIELAGAPIRRGRPRHRLVDRANRDPATFPDPDAFVATRPNARSHLAFAQGPARVRGRPPRADGDPGGARCRARRVAGLDGRGRNAADRRRLPQAPHPPGPLGSGLARVPSNDGTSVVLDRGSGRHGDRGDRRDRADLAAAFGLARARVARRGTGSRRAEAVVRDDPGRRWRGGGDRARLDGPRLDRGRREPRR